MRFYKLISVVLHPIILPTIGVVIYYLYLPIKLQQAQKLALLGLIFIVTCIIPLLLLVLLKFLNQINSYQIATIKERKFPVMFMVVLFYLLGSTFFNISKIRDVGLLFYATAFGLIIIYFLFIFKIKTSLHLLSMGVFFGFTLYLSTKYSQSFLLLQLIILFCSGLLASARLHLKAHTPKEVYLGFFLGIISPFLIAIFL